MILNIFWFHRQFIYFYIATRLHVYTFYHCLQDKIALLTFAANF